MRSTDDTAAKGNLHFILTSFPEKEKGLDGAPFLLFFIQMLRTRITPSMSVMPESVAAAGAPSTSSSV